MSNKDRLGNDIEDDVLIVKYDSHINELPPEVLAQIFCQIEVVQLCSIRLVCKYWNKIVSDNTIWQESFRLRFGSSEIFPSLTDTKSWIVEYLSRLLNLKRWRKAEATHRTYEVNSGDIWLTDFYKDRLLLLDHRRNEINICSLRSGRNQTFLPSYRYDPIAYSTNWYYYIFSSTNGGFYIKNLNMPASYNMGQQDSVKEVTNENPDDQVLSLYLNKVSDKHKSKPDILVGYQSGCLSVYNLSGEVIRSTKLDEPVIKIVSDFRKHIVAHTPSSIYVIDFESLELKQFKHGFQYSTTNPPIIDHDLTGCNVIFCFDNKIRVFNYLGNDFYVRKVDLNQNIRLGKLQNTISKVKRDTSVIGKDGLFYANVLDDNSIIVWNIRSEIEHIKMTCHFNSQFKYRSMSSVIRDEEEICAIDLNSSVIIVAGYNGFCNIHNVFTGSYMRDGTIKFPKKYQYMHNSPIPTTCIRLNEQNTITNGLIKCGTLVQVFQFGQDLKETPKVKSRKASMEKGGKRDDIKKTIKDQMDHYDLEKLNEIKLDAMFEKYNGNNYDSEDELMLAIALNESTVSNSNISPVMNSSLDDSIEDLHGELDEELLRAIELSKAELKIDTSNISLSIDGDIGAIDKETDVVDAEMQKAIELSKLNIIDHDNREDKTGPSNSTEYNARTDDDPDGEEDTELKRIIELSLHEQ